MMTPAEIATARWTQTEPLARADEEICPPGMAVIWTVWIVRSDGVVDYVGDDPHEVIGWAHRAGTGGEDARVRRSIIPIGSDLHLAALMRPTPGSLPRVPAPPQSWIEAERGLRAADEILDAAEHVVDQVAPPPPAPTDPQGLIEWVGDHAHRAGGDVVALLTRHAAEAVIDEALMQAALPTIWTAHRDGSTEADWISLLGFLGGIGVDALGGEDTVTLYRAAGATAPAIAWTADRLAAHGHAARSADTGGNDQVHRVVVDSADVIAVLRDDVIIDPIGLDLEAEELDIGAACVWEEKQHLVPIHVETADA